MNSNINKRLIGYTRVSTSMQHESGAGLAAQEKMIRDFCQLHGFFLLDLYTEAHTGGDDQRPILHQCIQACKEQGANIIVAKIDRLSRRMGFIASFQETYQLEFYVANLGLEINKTMLYLLAIFAELERDMISKRVKDGIAQKKREGTFKGAPGKKELWKDGKGNQAYREKTKKHREQIFREMVFICKRMKERNGDETYVLTKEEMVVELNNRGNRTVQGREWTLPNVRKLVYEHGEEMKQYEIQMK